MTTLEELLKEPSYGLKKKDKHALFVDHLNRLTNYHQLNCPPYYNILHALGYSDEHQFRSVEELPSLPVRLFKEHELRSIAKQDLFKTLTSSGTTSQKVSQIFLDRQTSVYQTKALVNILQHYLGKQRLPMLIVDHPNVVKDRSLFSARGAGILGLSNFGRKHTYVLNEDMEIDFDVLNQFLSVHEGSKILIFGFTFMVWQYLYQPLKESKTTINIPGSILIHSGGWKKLIEQAVDNDTFKRCMHEQTGVKDIHNFYGMVEQTGSIFVECERGHLHASNFSDIIIRNPLNWKVQSNGTEGVIEVISLLPHSYPGHVLLTEDLGTVYGEDDCACGKMGKYFSISGRIPQAEVRGCSDTHAESVQ